jgi:hypothetical protein
MKHGLNTDKRILFRVQSVFNPWPNKIELNDCD